MKLHSTNNRQLNATFAEGVVAGLADDGGLFMPDSLPRLPKAFFRNIEEMQLKEIAYVVMNILLSEIYSSAQLKKMVDEALNFDIPLHWFENDKAVLELYHGPTLSFKDVGARFMAQMLPLVSNHERHTVLVATSGDCGGAVADAFSYADDVEVCVLFARNELSEPQIAQFATRPNVRAIEVDGTFDDCQRLVKEVLNTPLPGSLGKVVTGNSINLARELPSVIYFFYCYANAKTQNQANDVVVSVPCGNLGNITAALIAKRMGLPISRFIASNSVNDTFVNYLSTGMVKPKRSAQTMAGCMDIGDPTNLARIRDLYNDDLLSLKADVVGCVYDDSQIQATMKEMYIRYNYLLDPLGAMSVRALNENIRPGETGIALGCTHPGKYANLVSEVTGAHVAMPNSLISLMQYPVRIMKIPPTLSALKRAMTMW